MTLSTGSKLAHYEITSQIGKGGMGEVYQAKDQKLGRDVAIKVLPEEFAKDSDRFARFQREAKLLASLNHPSIAAIHGFEESEGYHFLILELVEGETLADRIKRGQIPVEECLKLSQQIVEALESAHKNGVIHRDLKPSNIKVKPDGRVKVLDFGLAKHVPSSPQMVSRVSTLTSLTMQNTTIGTLPYMSPEQVQGKPLDHRSDLFSLGTVMYEMLTGVNYFRRGSEFDTASAIVNEITAPMSKYRDDVPRSFTNLIKRLLAKTPADRFQSTWEVSESLKKVIDEEFGDQISISRALFARVRKTLRKPVYLIPVLMLFTGLAYLAVQTVMYYQKAGLARDVLPKEIEQLMDRERPVAAARLLKEALRYAPESRELDQLKTVLLGSPVTIETEPPGADIYVRDYLDVEDADSPQWERLGRSPYSEQHPPAGYHRYRFVKDGLEPVEFAASSSGLIYRKLHPKEAIPEGMVWVSEIPKGRAHPAVAPAGAGEYWIDKFEVTNRQFKGFIDAGGYENRNYWKHPFIKGGRKISWEEAMAGFLDTTGRPGPATWQFGTYPEGKGDFPVGGVSWYEAAAYAEFAGKALPTVYHWYHAAGLGGFFAHILRVSNFSAKGPTQALSFRGLGDFGTYDMAGNIKEWCWNEVEGDRYIMGGAWNEMEYQFRDPDARQPFDRTVCNGFRCVKYITPPANALLEPVAFSSIYSIDLPTEPPANDQVYRIYKNLHFYDKTDLKAVVELVDPTSSQYWRRERVTFQAAYGNERVIADLYLPKNSKPPFQILLYLPSSNVQTQPALIGASFRPVEFLTRSGRAVIVPHYQATLERGPMPDTINRPDLYREIALQWSKDLGRSIDYLETRSDIDTERNCFFGLSWGGLEGPRLIAVEPRIKTAVLLVGGLGPRVSPEVDPWNFASRVRIPVLMLNGRNDYLRPLETSQLPLFRLLGTPEKDKTHIIYEGGHDIFNRMEVYKDILNWLDLYLGPVEIKRSS